MEVNDKEDNDEEEIDITVDELIGRCLAKPVDGMAWADLWGIVQKPTLDPMRELLRKYGDDVTLAEDIMQKLYFHLSADDHRRLRDFAGTSMGEFHNYLRRIAFCFTANEARARKTARKREARARHERPQPSREGPTEQDLIAAWEKLRLVMPAADYAKLKRLQSPDSSAPECSGDADTPAVPISARTRRWMLRVYFERYGQLLLDRLNL